MRTRSTLALVGVGIAIAIAIGGRASHSGDAPPSAPTTRSTTPASVETSTTPPTVRDPRLPITIVAGTLRLEGQAIDNDEHPIGGATITLAGTRTTITETDGSFAFDGLAAGDYPVTGEKQTFYGEDSVSLDASSEPLMLKLQSGPTMVLHVIDDARAPIANVAIESTGRTATTDRAGVARLRGLDTDDILVEFKAAGYGPLRARLATGDDPKATIDHTIVLHPGAPVGGVVVDQDGKPVADALVLVQSIPSTWREAANTDASGHWHVDSLGGGKHAVSAMSQEYVATSDQVFVHDGLHARSDLVVHVVLGGRISGTVTDRAGKPVAEASVSAGGSETTDAAGHFEVKGIAEGMVDVSATTKTQGSAIEHVNLARGAHLEVHLVVVDSSIAGTVRDSHGEPVDAATVYARGKGAATNASSFETTDELGHFDLGGMPPGDYELVVERKEEQGRTHAPNAIVRTGQRNVAIVLPELAGISGRVVLDGNPVDYFGVLIDAPDSLTYGHPTVSRTQDGRFEQHDLRPGRWGVVIVGPGFARKELTNVTVVDGQVTDLGDIVVEHGRRITGSTVDERGMPVVGATVTVAESRYTTDDLSLGSELGGTRTVVSGADGRFAIDGIDETKTGLLIRASSDGGVATPHELAASDSDIELVIARTGSIDGTVANAHDVSRIRVRSAGEHDHFSAELDLAGDFHVDHLPPGDYDVSIAGRNTLPPKRVTVVAAASVSVAFTMPVVPITIVVHVVGATETYVRITTLSTEDGSSEWLENEQVANGVAELTNVSPGSYQLCVDLDTCIPLEVPSSPQRQDVTVEKVASPVE